jgi:hypothetical protein
MSQAPSAKSFVLLSAACCLSPRYLQARQLLPSIPVSRAPPRLTPTRLDVTNSSRVVSYGSLQAENGASWTVRQVPMSSVEPRLGCASASRSKWLDARHGI